MEKQDIWWDATMNCTRNWKNCSAMKIFDRSWERQAAFKAKDSIGNLLNLSGNPYSYGWPPRSNRHSSDDWKCDIAGSCPFAGGTRVPRPHADPLLSND